MTQIFDFMPLFSGCSQSVSDALKELTIASLRIPTGSIGAGGDSTLHIDQVAENAALTYLAKTGYTFNILSEEAGFLDHQSDVTLIIDPIDQTINAQRGLPYFAFSIAAYKDGIIIAGHVRNLGNGDVFYATRSGGAFMNGQPIHASQCGSLSEAHCFVIRAGQGLDRPEYHRFFFETRLLRVTGCSSLDLCYIASGQWDACIHADQREGHGEKVVDVAAAKIILEEGGGVVRDANGGEFPIVLDLHIKHPIVAAATLELMSEILVILKT